MVKRSAARSSGAGSAKELAAKQRKMSPEALANQKIRGNYRDLGQEETDVIICASTGRNLRQQVTYDCARWQQGQDILFGPHYHDNIRSIYSRPKDWFLGLKPTAGGQVDIRPTLLKACSCPIIGLWIASWSLVTSFPLNDLRVRGCGRE